MDFTSINSINNYIKSIDLQQKWQQKQETKNFSPDKKSIDEWVEEQKKKLSENNEEQNKKQDKTLNNIKTKLSSGASLTPQEMRYLQMKDPASYARAQSVATERAYYQRQLMTCRTKEDVHRYKMIHAASALSEYNSIKNDRNMSAEEKAEAIAHVRNKMSAVEKETNKFVRSGDYASLPTDRERIKAEKDMARARREECRSKYAKKRARIERDKKKKRQYQLKSKPKYTVLQAQNTREAVKVRRANAKAAYYESMNAALATITFSSKELFVSKA